jgi:hypothetical protein
MNDTEKRFIEIENDLGEVEVAEVICTINSEREDKTYVVLTQDEEIGEEVNVIIGTLREDDGNTLFAEVESDEEFEYVVSLMEKIERSEENVV